MALGFEDGVDEVQVAVFPGSGLSERVSHAEQDLLSCKRCRRCIRLLAGYHGNMIVILCLYDQGGDPTEVEVRVRVRVRVSNSGGPFRIIIIPPG